MEVNRASGRAGCWREEDGERLLGQRYDNDDDDDGGIKRCISGNADDEDSLEVSVSDGLKMLQKKNVMKDKSPLIRM